ncbi:CusA/CzcA family heavy metal efflux RND transporter [Immundisolibacter sp.]|uniref:efflux RND transporter permease subunit n=1 Tax=Immundisolibacter sp. TaxID=1934948 RepID=UPI002639A3B1|nr:CusA/CzcA family heavy metal efflux RND transporter [Immundisolibacter sp.]MDD3652165.1 CusA/CzcA family heavy metal efflux RND transporter [Immundisolibacter sp.]
MLQRLIEFALAQRAVVLLVTALGVGAGIAAWRQLPIDAFPDISPTQVKLILKAPGMTPQEVEQRILVPLEMELLGLPRQVQLRALAKYAIADVTLVFADGTDIYWARQQVAERYAGVRDALPAGVEGGLAPIATPLSDLFMFTIEGDLSLAEKRDLLDWTIRPALRTVPGVADVNALGGRVRTYEVVPDRAALAAAGVTLQELAAALETNNQNDGAGRLRDGEEALVVRATAAYGGLDDVASVVVARQGGRVLRVADLAQVRFGELAPLGAVSKDGHGEAVEAIVVGLRGADAGAVVAGVRERLAALQPSLPPGVTLNVFYDRSDLIARAVGTVTDALLEAAVLVVVLLLLFLGELRAALVVAMTLPLAALGTFILMRLTGMSANLMSLGGLAIAIGMLVDAAVVVVENAVERLGSDEARRLPRLHVLFRAVTEVAQPVATGVLIIALVFVPLLTLQGLEGKLFAPVALSIVYALGVSLLVGLTFIPVLASLVLRPGAHHEPWLMRKLGPVYARLLGACLRRPAPLIAVAVIGLLLAAGAYSRTGKAFMPTLDEGAILVQLAKLPSIDVEASLELDQAVQRALLAEVPEVKSIVARLGSDDLGLDPMSLNDTDSFLVLAPKDAWRVPDKDWLADRLREVLSRFPGIEFTFTQPIEMRISEMLTGARGDLAVKIFGPDLAELDRLAGRIAAVLEQTPGASEVFTVHNAGVQYLEMQLDRLAAGRAGLDAQGLQAELRAQVDGLRAGTVLEGNKRIPLMVRGDPRLRSDAGALAETRIALPGGGSARLADLARVSRVSGPVKVDREDGARFAVVQANVGGRDLVGYVADAQARVAAAVPLPPGYRLVWGGQFENQQRAAARLGLVVPVALGLIFFVLFATLGSVRQAVLILSNIPFALIGGAIALWASGEYLSVPASVGFIALLGIAVLNGLVLLTHFNQLRAAGLPLAQVVYDGARRRLRPVLMTAGITALGLVPLLLQTGPGSEIQRPLAIVVLGGLFTSTALTLLLLPILYRRFGAPEARP